jgi:hypothetical protein
LDFEGVGLSNMDGKTCGRDDLCMYKVALNLMAHHEGAGPATRSGITGPLSILDDDSDGNEWYVAINSKSHAGWLQRLFLISPFLPL